VIEALATIDRALFLTLNSLHSEYLNHLMLVMSGQAVWAFFIPFFLWLNRNVLSRRELLFFIFFLLLTIAASDVTSSYILKNIFTRLRPCRVTDLQILIYQFGQKCGGKFGFVSSHAANSFALVTFSLLSMKSPRRLWNIVWLMPLIVSYSRIYLGVHYPGDVLGGTLVGIFWGTFFAWSFKQIKAPIESESSH
jgi:undecaprenyl-diphosphatase